jgi:hypothetical protein
LVPKGDTRISFTTKYSAVVTMVYSPSPFTVSTADTASSPDTVMMQSPTRTLDAYMRERGAEDPQDPAGIMWFEVILTLLPAAVEMWVKSDL